MCPAVRLFGRLLVLLALLKTWLTLEPLPTARGSEPAASGETANEDESVSIRDQLAVSKSASSSKPNTATQPTTAAYSTAAEQPSLAKLDEPISIDDGGKLLQIGLGEHWNLDPPRPVELGVFPSVKVNGVFQADSGYFSQDAANYATFGRLQDGADFRRARLSASGSVTELTRYFFQMDFAFFGRPSFTDLWVEFNEVPLLGNVRVGQWKQPFSLEVVSSFRYTTFMERSLLFIPFTPFRHLGIGFYDHTEDFSHTWALSGFRSGNDHFGSSTSHSGGRGLAGRLTWLPWYDEPAEGRYFMHLGTGLYYHSPVNDRVRFRSIPEIFIGEVAPGLVGTSGVAVPGAQNGTPHFVDTGLLVANDVTTFGSEWLWVRGPLSLQHEAMVAIVNQEHAPTVALPGAYLTLGYFLTGEHRPYERRDGTVGRVLPLEDFFWVRGQGSSVRGLGAWELASRWSYINLNDDNVRGGQLNDMTLGVNWYANANTKFAFNYIHAMLQHPSDGHQHMDAFAMRAQVDF